MVSFRGAHCNPRYGRAGLRVLGDISGVCTCQPRVFILCSLWVLFCYVFGFCYIHLILCLDEILHKPRQNSHDAQHPCGMCGCREGFPSPRAVASPLERSPCHVHKQTGVRPGLGPSSGDFSALWVSEKNQLCLLWNAVELWGMLGATLSPGCYRFPVQLPADKSETPSASVPLHSLCSV